MTVLLYVLMCYSWAVFATLMNAKFHPARGVKHNALCFAVNFIGFPVAMWVAIYMLVVGKHDKYFKNKQED